MILLQQFTGNIQGQVRGIYQTFDEAQVVRQQVFAFFHNKYGTGEKLQARFIFLEIQVGRSLARNVQQRRVFHGALCPGVVIPHGVFPFVELVLEKFVVFFRLDGTLIPFPQRGLGVQGLVFCFFNGRQFVVDVALVVAGRFFRGFFHFNRIADVIGIFFHQAFQRPVTGHILFRPFACISFAQLQGDAGAVFFHFAGFDGIGSVSSRLPLPAFLFPGLAGNQGHFIRNHERGIKTYTELTDQVFGGSVGLRFLAGFFLCLFRNLVGFFQFGPEFLGTGLGDSADVFDYFFFGHADAVIRNGKGLCLFIRGQTDHKLAVPFQQFAVGKGRKTQLVDGVAGVGNQFTQKNLVVGVNGIDH